LAWPTKPVRQPPPAARHQSIPAETVGRQHAACTDATKQAVNESIPAETEGAAPQIKPAVNV